MILMIKSDTARICVIQIVPASFGLYHSLPRPLNHMAVNMYIGIIMATLSVG